jgi:hypothetical protein
VITQNQLQKSLSYLEYRILIDSLMAQNKTTGTDQSEAMVNYGKLNLQRMQRLEKTVIISNELKSCIEHLNKKLIFLVITEGWCGDAAQNVPVFSFMENISSNIELKLLLRDENPELIDKYLTNGARAIPKLICLEKDTLKELFVWGPRPEPCQKIMLEMKAKNADSKVKAEAIHLWYARDKTATLQKEILELLKSV